MITLYNCKWLGKWYGLTIWPFILYREARGDVSPWQIAHEEYHWKHQLRWGVIPWFITYGLLILLYGYSEHPWEKLARNAENNGR